MKTVDTEPKDESHKVDVEVEEAQVEVEEDKASKDAVANSCSDKDNEGNNGEVSLVEDDPWKLPEVQIEYTPWSGE